MGGPQLFSASHVVPCAIAGAETATTVSVAMVKNHARINALAAPNSRIMSVYDTPAATRSCTGNF